jgi:hypothetical protein
MLPVGIRALLMIGDVDLFFKNPRRRTPEFEVE